MRMLRFLPTVLLLILLAGCGAPAAEPAATDRPPTELPPTAAPSPLPSPSPSLPAPAAVVTPTMRLDPTASATATEMPEAAGVEPTQVATMTLPVIINDNEGPWSVLLFTRTAGFRHASIVDGVAAVQALGAEHGFDVLHTEDATLFNDADLAQHRVVIFLSTTGNILDDEQQAAFERYVQAGGSFVGIHAATDTEYDWPWYGGLVGAYFANHPAVQQADIDVVDAGHPSTSMLPSTWTRRDEWYNFATDPSAQVNVLLNLDESSYSGGSMGASHPIAWYQVYDGGRSWYTAGGHTRESFSEPLFLDHIAGGILWAAGEATTP